MTSSAGPLPTGTLTFLSTDVDGSTRRWEVDEATAGPAGLTGRLTIESRCDSNGQRGRRFGRYDGSTVASMNDRVKGVSVTDINVEQEVRAALEASLEALNNGDRESFASSLSTSAECTMIGSDPDEWYTGEQLLANWDEAMSAGGNPVRAVQDEVFVHVNGDVAWVEGRGRCLFLGPAASLRAVLGEILVA